MPGWESEIRFQKTSLSKWCLGQIEIQQSLCKRLVISSQGPVSGDF